MNARTIAVLLGSTLLLTGCRLPGTSVLTPPSATGRSGGTLTVGITAPSGIDPLTAYNGPGRLVLSTMCDQLVQLDPVSGEVKPGLASTIVTADNGSTITLKLRHGLHFPDGHELVAKDVVQSLSRLASSTSASYDAELLAPLNGFDKLHSQLLEQSGTHDLAGVQPTGKYDVQLLVRKGAAGFLRALAEPATTPVESPSPLPECVGPYQLSGGWNASSTLIHLVRTPGYIAKNVGYTGGGRGYADTIDFHVFPVTAVVQRAYQQGTVDVVASAGAGTVSRTTAGLELIGLPTGVNGIFGSVHLRRALSLALDRQVLIDKVWHGRRTPADGFLPAAFGKDTKPAACNDVSASADRQRAVAELSLAEVELKHQGFDLHAGAIKVTTNEDFAAVAEMQEAVRQWRDVLGLSFEITTQPWASYSAAATNGAGLGAVFRVSWSLPQAAPVPTYNDPSQLLEPLFSTDSTDVANWGHFSDPELDYALGKAAEQSDPTTRGQTYAKLAGRLCHDLPGIPVAFDRAAWDVTAGWTSDRPVGLDGLPLLRELHET